MYILKNALRSISRSKVRNILIFVLILVIVISACVSLSIMNSAEEAKEATLENQSITAEISVNRESFMEQARSTDSGEMDRDAMREAMQDMPQSLSIEEQEKYAESEYVKDFYYTATTSVNGNDDLEPIDTSATGDESSSNSGSSNSDSNSSNAPSFDQAEGSSGGSSGSPEASQGGPQRGMGTQGDFSIIGYSSHDGMTSFISGENSITEGSMFDQEDSKNNCIISSELALLNDIAVSDTITIVNPNDEDETATLTVCGIYESSDNTSTEPGGMGGFGASSDPANQIFMSYTSLSKILTTSESNATTSTDSETGRESSTAMRNSVAGTYVFSDTSDYENFVKDVESMGLDSDSYTVESTDLESYEQSLVPLNNLSKYAMYFLIIVLVIGGIILVVFNLFAIRERKYEIGVLAAIGMKKGKVAIQFISELLIVTIIALIIGGAIGSVISVPVADALLENQIESSTSASNSQNQRFGDNFQGGGGQPPSMPGGSGGMMESRGPGSAVEYIDSIQATVDFGVLMSLLGIGILLSIISSSGAVISILRYEPLRILSDRT